MTKHEADVIGGLNMTDQISNEAYRQIMIAAQDENEVGEVLDKIRAGIKQAYCNITNDYDRGRNYGLYMATEIIDKYKEEGSGEE